MTTLKIANDITGENLLGFKIISVLGLVQLYLFYNSAFDIIFMQRKAFSDYFFQILWLIFNQNINQK